ncbi:MAG: DNA gyrase inhibitor YacG [Pseudomonadota bacterium]
MTARKCPICGKPRVHEHRPFCSKRCADIDLGKWAGGVYAIPGEEVAVSSGTDPEGPDAPKGSAAADALVRLKARTLH